MHVYCLDLGKAGRPGFAQLYANEGIQRLGIIQSNETSYSSELHFMEVFSSCMKLLLCSGYVALVNGHLHIFKLQIMSVGSVG